MLSSMEGQDMHVQVFVQLLGLPTKKSKVLRFQICFTRTKYLSEIYKNGL